MKIKYGTHADKHLVIANGENCTLNNMPSQYQGSFAELILVASEAAQIIQGPMALGSSRRTAAVHEAGHAVVAQVTAGNLFPIPYKMRVYQESGMDVEVGEVWLGSIHYPPDTPDFVIEPDDVLGMHKYSLRTLAGVVAEQLFAPDDYRVGSSLDEQAAGFVAAGNIAHTIGRDHMDVLYGLFRLTGEILKHNRRPLQHIAGWLDKHQKLSGRRLMSMLNGVELPAIVADLGLGGGK